MNQRQNKEKKDLIFAIIVCISLFVRVLIQLLLPIWARGDYIVDDYLMVRYASSLSAFDWLGSYDSYALNKVPGYAVFLALSNLSKLPYMFNVGVFYAIAALIFLVVIRKYIKNDILALLCFWYVLFSPVMFDDNVAQKLYRQVIIPPLVLMIVSSYMAIYYERRNGIKKILPWSVLASICIGYFTIAREDSMWFNCFILGATILLAGLFVIENRSKFQFKDFCKHCSCILIPAVSGIIATHILCMVNYLHYGLYVENDYNQTYFAKVCETLMSIEPEEELPRVYISKSTVERAFEISPTFVEMQDELEKRYNEPSSSGLANGEFQKAMFVWNLRWAADSAGLYRDPIEMNQFFEKVYNELQRGFESGVFEKREAFVISPWARPIREGDIVNIFAYSMQGYRDIITYTDIGTVIYNATGTDLQIEKMEDMTNQDIPDSEDQYHLKGWIFGLDAIEDEDVISIKIYDSIGNEFYPVLSESNDVYNFYLNQGVEYEQAKNCRFETRISEDTMDLNELFISVKLGKTVIYEGSVNEFSVADNENIKAHLDVNEMIETKDKSISTIRAAKLLNLIVRGYQVTGLIIAIVSLMIYFIEVIINVINWFKKRNTEFSFWLIKTGLLMTIWVNLVVVSVNYFETDPHNFREYYAAGVYPIWQIFICLSLYSVSKYMLPYVRTKIRATHATK